MKRTPLARKTPLKAKPKPSTPRKPLPKVNSRQQAKRRKSYAQKLAAYRRSETYKIVEKRAGGFCEHWRKFGWIVGCEVRGKLHHHHLTYARFGGNELPEDMLAVCKSCHELLESGHPTRQRRY